LNYLSSEYNVVIKPIYFDLSNKEEMKNAVKFIMSEKRQVDILVNNAGITYNALFQMSTIDKIQEVLDINFISPFLFTQYAVKLMLKNKSGVIVNISSSAAIDGNSGRSVYGASKAALICATKAIAAELGDSGIRANVIAPGITQTDMLSSMTDDIINETVMNTDMKRAGKTSDIANAVLFLASDLSSYITGQVIRVDGGM
jgi:3-oxoacyl-[acyl-carrier protein] reductase